MATPTSSDKQWRNGSLNNPISMQKMNVLHVSKYYYPYIGGVENTCKQIVEGITNQFDSAVVCFSEGEKDYDDIVNGHKIYRVGSWLNVARQALSPTYIFVLRRAIKEFAPDIIHFHWANPFPAAILLMTIPKNVKLIVHWHMDIIKQKRIYPFIKPVETALLKRANLIIVTSPQYRDTSLPLEPFTEKIRVVPNAIDAKALDIKEGDDKRIKDINEKYFGRKIVFFIGRHIQYKGLPYLLAAEKHIKSECEIVIAGKGPLTKELKAQCQSPRVHFVGRLDDDELRSYLHSASVFAFPSITRNEAFGLALAEAMYCGKPAVTFTIPGSGVNWVNLDGITGLEAPNKDVTAFAANIDKLLTDVELAQRLGQAGRKRVIDNFTIPIMINKMTEVYKSLYSCAVAPKSTFVVNKPKTGGVIVKVSFRLAAQSSQERRAA